VARLVRRSTCSRIVCRKPRLLVEILVGEQLEETAEREQRRAQLVRGVRDELLAGRVQLGQLHPHALEGPSELPELVLAEVDHRLVELSLRDPVRGPLEAADPARVHRRGDGAEAEGDRERGQRRVQELALDELDRGELVGKRRGQEHHPAGRQQRHGDFRVLAPATLDATPLHAVRACGVDGRRVTLDRRRGDRCGVGEHRERDRGADHLVEDDARVERRRGTVDERVEAERRAQVVAQQPVHERRRVALQLVELRVDEPLLEPRHDHQVGNGERAGHDRDERDRELDADPARGAHVSWKR
jgi:hypothetical protein